MKHNKKNGRPNNDISDKARVKKNVSNENTTTNNPLPKELQQQKKNDRRNNIMACVIIALLSILLYIQTVPYEYVLDDKAVITNNQFTKKGVGGIMEIMGADIFQGIKAQKSDYVAGGRYRPLSLVTFAVEWELSPNNPSINHITNIILYALTGILIFLLLKKLLMLSAFLKSQNEDNPFANYWFLTIPFVATLLFIAHPLHTEVIASIKGRDEIMVFLGSLAALWFSITYIETKKWMYLGFSFVVFLLSLLTKENAITFVAIVPLTIYYFDIKQQNNKGIKRTQNTNKGASVVDHLITIAPLIIAFVLFMMIRRSVIGKVDITAESQDLMNNSFVGMNFSERYATIFMTLGNYIKLLLFPHPLTFDYYPYHIPKINWTDWRAPVSLLFYIGMGLYALMGMRKKKLVSYGIFFYLITFSIVSNVFFSIGAFMTERFMYIPSLGFVFILAYLLLVKLPQIAANKNIPISTVKIVVPALLLVILGLYSFKTIDRNPAWESEYALFTTDVKTSKESAKGNYAAGFAYAQRAKEDSLNREKNYKIALKYLEKSVEIHPKFENALIFKGTTHYEYNKDYQKAIESYFKVLEFYPKYKKVYDYVLYILANDNKIPSDSLTKTYEALNTKSAQMVNNNPNNAFVLRKIAINLYKEKKFKEAMIYFEKTLKIKKDDALSYKFLGFIFANMGKFDVSIGYLEQAFKLAPNDQQTANVLIQVYNKLGQKAKAKEMYDRLQQLKQK